MGHKNSKIVGLNTIKKYQIPHVPYQVLDEMTITFIDDDFTWTQEEEKVPFYVHDEMIDKEVISQTLTSIYLTTYQALNIIINDYSFEKLNTDFRKFTSYFGHDVKNFYLSRLCLDIIDSLDCKHRLKKKTMISMIHQLKRAWRVERKNNLDHLSFESFLYHNLPEHINHKDYVYIMKHFTFTEDYEWVWLDGLICICSEKIDLEQRFLNRIDESTHRPSRMVFDYYFSFLFEKTEGSKYIKTDDTNDIVDSTLDLVKSLDEVGVEFDEEDLEAIPTPTPFTKKIEPKDIKNINKIIGQPKKSNLRSKVLHQTLVKRSHKPYWRNAQDKKTHFINPQIKERYDIIIQLKMKPMHINRFFYNNLTTRDVIEEDIGEALQMFSLMDETIFTDREGSIGSMSPRKVNYSIEKNHSDFELAEIETAVNILMEAIESNLSGKPIEQDVKYLTYMYLQALAKHGEAKEAWEQLKTWLIKWDENNIAHVTRKSRGLSPTGIIYWLTQVRKRGLSLKFDKNICLDRRLPLTDKDWNVHDIEELLKTGKYFRTFSTPKSKTCAIQMGTLLNAYTDEMRYYRISDSLHSSIFNRCGFLSYMYKYYYPQRKLEGTSETDDEDDNDSTSDITEERDDDPPNPFDTNNEASKGFIRKKIDSIISSFTSTIGKERDGIVGPLKDGLSNIYDQIVRILTKLETFMDDCISSITKFFDKLFGGKGGVVLTALDILHLLVYYLIYINTSNTFIKGAALFFLVKKLGLVQIIKAGIEYIFEKTIDFSAFEEPKEGVEGTSEGDNIFDTIIEWFSNITAENLGKIATILIVGFTSLIGIKMTTKINFNELGKTITEKARNWHFLGAGLFGIERVMKYFGATFKVVADFLKKMFSKEQAEAADMTETELKDLQVKVVSIDVKLIHYSSHSGMEEIRTNADKAADAQDVVREALKIYSESRLHDKKYPIEIKRMITGFRKNMIDVLNIVQRVQNVLKPRETPFHVQFFAQPGVGKSTLIGQLVSRIQKEFYPKMGYNAVAYSRNPSDSFWPGYVNQPIVIVDEMYPVLEAEVLVEWMIYISNLPVMVPMAELSEKVTYFNSEWILSNTNVSYPKANGVASIEAVWRRRHLLVEIDIDDRVQDKSTGKFCKKLFDTYYPDQNTLDFPHLKFNLLKPVPDNADATSEAYIQGDLLPDGLREPTSGLNYNEFWKQLMGRQACLKQEERNLRRIDISLRNLDVESIWSDVIEFYNNKNLRVRSKDFFELNKPCIDFAMNESVGEGPSRQEFKIEEENVELTSTIKEKEHLVMKYVFEFFEELDDGTKMRPLCEIEICGSKMFVRNASDIKCTNYLTIVSQLGQSSSTPQPIRDWFSEHSFSVRTESFGFTFEHKGVKGTDESDEDMEITKLRQLIVKMEKSGKHAMAAKFKDKLDHMVNGNKPKVYADKFDEFVGERYFGFEEISNRTGAQIEQPKGVFVSKLKSQYSRKGNNFISPMNGLYMSLRLSDFTPMEFHTNVFNYSTLKDNVVDELEFLKYRNQFCLTQKEKDGDLWLTFEGRNTGITFKFIECVEKIDNEYWFKYEDSIIDTINADRKKLKKSHLQYSPINIMADFKMYNSLVGFNLLNEARKDFLLRNVKSLKRNMYSKLRSESEHAKECRERIGANLDKLCNLDRFSGIFRKLKRVIYVSGALCGIVYLMRQIGALFGGVSETSKVYFKQKGAIKHLTGTLESVFPQHEDHMNAITKNMMKVRIEYGGKVSESNALGMLGNVFVMCKHPIQNFIDSEDDSFVMSYRRSKHEDVDFHTAKILKENIVVFDDRDLVVIKSDKVAQFKNITKFLYDADVLKKRKPEVMKTSLLYNTKGSGWNRVDFPNIKHHDSWKDKLDTTGEKVQISNCYSYFFDAPLGSSGGILLNHTNETQCILGFQCFTDHSFSYASTLTLQSIQRALDKLNGPGIETMGPAFVNPNGVSATENLITSNVVIEGTINEEKVLGSYSKSSYFKSPIYDLMPKSKRIPAILSAFDERVPEGKHPLQHSINKYGRDRMEPLNNDILEHASEQLSLYYGSRINTQIEFLDMTQVIRGIKNVEPMNVKTSPGIPWVYGRKQPGKKDYIRYDEDGEIEFLAEEVIDEFEKLEAHLLLGVIPPMSAYEFPKDELRPIEKVEQLKTRSIGVLPMELNMVYRKYNAGVDGAIRALANGNNPVCIGCNPDSLTWNEIYTSLKSKSNYGMDFDVGNWDGHLPHELKQANNRMEDELAKNAPINISYYERIFEKVGITMKLSEDEIRKMITVLREALSQSISYGFINFCDIVLQVIRGLRSGYGGTGDENCRCHSILIVYFINEVIYEKFGILISIDELFEYVSFFVYGDDVVIAIKEEFLTLVNYEEIISKYEYYGWPITSATKVGKVEPKPIEELQFLKRKFVQAIVKGMPIMVGALDEEVIYDLTYWTRKGKRNEEQFYENLDNALSFMWAHGKIKTEKFIKEINHALHKRKMKLLTKTWKVIDTQMQYRIINEREQ